MRNSLGITRGLALGIKSMGATGTILASFVGENSLENILALVQQWQEEVEMLYTPLGKKTTEELTSIVLILDPILANWCHNRGIDSTVFTKR